MLFYLPDFSTPELPETEAQHALKVLRKKRGDTIRLTNGNGMFARAIIENDNPKKCRIRIIETIKGEDEAPEKIWLAVAPTKQMERMEWMVEKCTEIGINGFLFFHSQRTERTLLKLERLEKVAISAMKQSGQSWLPEIKWCPQWNHFPWNEFDQIFVADLQANASDVLLPRKGNNLIFIGPEGDFSDDEYREIKDHGAKRIRLRPQILRTETAALFALCQARIALG